MIKLKRVGKAEPDHNNPYIEYIQKFKEVSKLPSECTQLDNGVTIIELFMLIKGFKLLGSYEENPRTFSHSFTNLKLLLESIENYWNE